MKWSSIDCDISFELAERKKRHTTAKVEGCRKVFKSTKKFVKFKWNGECHTTMMRQRKKNLFICTKSFDYLHFILKFN